MNIRATLSQALLAPVADYYSSKIAQFGSQPRGVDWNGADGQNLRFQQLCKVFDENSAEVWVADIGCGYGALIDYLTATARPYRYVGVDISPAMIDAARRLHGDNSNVELVIGTVPAAPVDYAVASGIFNVKLGADSAEWEHAILATLDGLQKSSIKGFSFNCLTSWSDEDRKRPDLFYADPARLFDHCKRHYSRNVALLHDYGLYEFTMVIRK